MGLAGGEIRKRHFVGAACFGVHLMHFPGNPVRRQPFRHRLRIEERQVNAVGAARSTRCNRTLLVGMFLAPFR
jgi:hypothetical protein